MDEEIVARATINMSPALDAGGEDTSLSPPNPSSSSSSPAAAGVEGDVTIESSESLSESSSESAENEADEEEEGDVCRICRNPGDDDNPLRYPCACSGSIKFVHQDCLLQWLNHSNARQCEVCKHAFSFSPVYAENAPARLPFQEFVVGMAMKGYLVLQFFLRLGFVLSVWLLIIPFITFWIWRLTFVRSVSEAQRIFLSHLTAPLILTDCLHGFLLSASIVFIFLGATSLRDYVRNFQEMGAHDVEREDEGNDRHGARAVRRLPGPPNRVNVGDVNGEGAAGAQAIAGPGNLIRRNAENVAARLEMQAARLEAHVEQIFDGLDDADGAEDVPFDELVGMQGPVFHLVENAVTVLASNAIFLAAVILFPFSLGRLVLFYLSWTLGSASSPLLLSVMPLTETTFSLANITFKNALTAFQYLSSDNNSEGVLGDMMGAVAETLNANGTSTVRPEFLRETKLASSRLSDLATLAIGYMCISFLLAFYLGLVALIRYARGERVTIGRLASIIEAVPSLFRQFVAGMRHLMTMIKVALLLVIELGVFPLMCGWWLDVCTLKMLGASIAQRVEFSSMSPLASSLIHWLVGIVYMLQISIFVSLLRGVLRHGVLYFLRDPADPNYNPFRDLIDDPVHKHARRVLLSVAVYGSLIVMLVFLPVKLCMRMAPSVFPLDITVSDPFTEIPADMLLFQFCIPFAIKHFKPRVTLKALLYYWLRLVGWALGLTDFLLPRPEEHGQENGNMEQGALARLQDIHQGGALQQDRPLLPHLDAGDRIGGHVLGNEEATYVSDSYDQADSEYGFVLRIILLLVLAWMTLLLLNSALIVIPISLGRALFNAIPRLPFTHGIKCNDLYAFIIGCYVIWSVAAGAKYSIEYIRTGRASVFVSQVWKWCAIVLKSTALLSIWIIVIPVLIGLLFELLVIVPMRVPVDESPVFLLYQDWALGLIFLKIWTRLVMLDQMALLVDGSWRTKFERVREDGFSRLRGFWVLREIVIPIVVKLLTALCVPYVFAKGVFPVLGYSLIVNSAVYRFAWLGCLLFSMVYFCAWRFHVWFTNLHNSIRDDRYLIGRRLHNYGEEIIAHRGDSESESPVNWHIRLQDAGRLGQGAGLRFRHAAAQQGRQVAV